MQTARLLLVAVDNLCRTTFVPAEALVYMHHELLRNTFRLICIKCLRRQRHSLWSATEGVFRASLERKLR